jgi:hypothetical protein
MFKQKSNLLKLIKKYNIPIIQLSNDNYKEFLYSPEGIQNIDPENDVKREDELDFSQIYPQLSRSSGKGKTLHNLIMPRDLKKLLLVVNTENGNAARDFVISLDELFNLYWEYQSAYKSHQLTLKDEKLDLLSAKIDDQMGLIKNQSNMINEQLRMLNNQNVQLGELKEDNEIIQGALTNLQDRFEVVADERAPRTRSIATRDRFMIIKLNKPNCQWTYYAIRVQHVSLNSTLKKLRSRYPQFTELISIPYQPNGINFFNLMKQELDANKITFQRNKIKLAASYTEDQFVRDIEDLDMARRDVDSESESDE